MADPTRYAALICSLPYLRGPFAHKRSPISRLRLERRLAMLAGEDAALLARIEAIARWRHLPLQASEADLLRLASTTLAETPEGLLKALLVWLLDVRTIMAALRRRRRGERLPAAPAAWGRGAWVEHIERHWTEADFSLGRVFPWLAEANRLLTEGDHIGLERLLLGCVWTHLDRIGAHHTFDFEGVVVYALKWDVIERWTRHNATAASRRFQTLMQAGLGEYQTLYQ